MASFATEFCEWFSELDPAPKVLVVVGGGGLALGVGLVAAPAVGAAVSAAGIGVAGGTLSGAAASSAGLAALGGGSIAAGGLGVAGGTAVVGATAGLVGTGTATAAALKVSNQGRTTRNAVWRAESRTVVPGEVNLEK